MLDARTARQHRTEGRAKIAPKKGTVFDQQFHEAVVRAAIERALVLLAQDEREARGAAHRELMRDAKVLLSLVATPAPTGLARSELVSAAAVRLDALRGLQTDSGLFTGGDNLQSPPDSAFTINDACDAHAFLGDAANTAGVHAVRGMLEAIVRAAAGSLLHGGVHTPNHRWEISAALARIHRSFPDRRLVDRVDEWLAEGVDIDADGLYSERSPNYAAHVSNPSLAAIAGILARPELDAIVLRNLDATLTLIRPDDTVETVQSRRQDQRSPFPLSPYLTAFRTAAVATGRTDFAAAARRAAACAPLAPELLGESLLRPALLEQLPAVSPAPSSLGPASYHLGTAGLAGRRTDAVEAVIYAGSDYAAARGIRSGLANNPTFCRVFAGEAILDSVRLSRAFFDLGPFRADSMRRVGEDVYVLREEVVASYYQPLSAADRDPHGRYALLDDGRFSAAMSFPRRQRDVVTMTTVVQARLVHDGVDLDVRIDAPRLPWSIEFGFRDGGTVSDGVLDTDGTWVLPTGRGAYRVGGSGIRIVVDGVEPSDRPLRYQPGQDYELLGGTDAVGGVRVRVGGMAPASFTVRIRSEKETTR